VSGKTGRPYFVSNKFVGSISLTFKTPQKAPAEERFAHYFSESELAIPPY